MLRLLRLWRIAGNDLRLLWFALRHPARPLWLIPVVALLGVYALEPINLVLPLVGILDDVVLLPLVLHVLLRFLPPAIRDGFALRSLAQ